MGCYSPSSYFWEKILAIMLFKASVSSIKGCFRLKWASKGANTSYFLSLLKACIHIALKWKGWSFLVRRLRGWAILL